MSSLHLWLNFDWLHVLQKYFETFHLVINCNHIFYQLHISMLKPLQDNWLHKHSWNRMKYKHVEHNYPLGNSIWIFMINNFLSLTVGPYSVNPKCTVPIKIPENLQVNTNTNKMLNPQTSSSCFYFSAALPTFTKEQQSGTTKMTKSIAFPSKFSNKWNAC